MEKLTTLVLICSLVAALVVLSLPVLCQEVEDESEFNYDEESDKGPSNWGHIRPEWSLCKKGNMQSPIDLLNKRVEIVSNLGKLQINYQPSNGTIKNRGHDIKLGWDTGAGYLQINETKYTLKQCHWHSPSEHTIDGKRLDLELHLVHETPSGQAAVIGIFYKIGRPDSFLSSLTKDLKAISGDEEGKSRVVGVVDPRKIDISSGQYYRYIGSLTIPPCTENITWTMTKEVKSVSKEQIKLLRVSVHDESDTNARPLQPKNNRLVQLNRPKDLKYQH